MSAATVELVDQDGGSEATSAEGSSWQSFVDGLVEMVTAASPETLGRAVFAVSALHAPDCFGRCPVCTECRPGRFGRRRGGRTGLPCPTLLVLRFALAHQREAREAGR